MHRGKANATIYLFYHIVYLMKPAVCYHAMENFYIKQTKGIQNYYIMNRVAFRIMNLGGQGIWEIHV